MKASGLGGDPKPALATVVIHPNEWSTKYTDKPDRDVCFGLRLPSDYDESAARREGTEATAQRYQGSGDIVAATEELNDAIMALMVAVCICDPNDYRKEPAHLPLPQDTIRHALRSETIRRIWERIELLKVTESPASPEADDVEVAALADVLVDGIPSGMDPHAGSRMRRLLFAALSELESDSADE
jgi:hypothetical protein